MIFYRSPDGTARELSVHNARLTSTSALVLYPTGALLRQFGPDAMWADIVGLLMVVTAFGFALWLAGSSIQRIVAEEETQLDEYELKLRYQSIASAYAILSALFLVLVFSGEVILDLGGSIPPITDDVFSGLFWLVFLYATLLPTTILAWRLDPEEGVVEVVDDE
jgi:hypothetical protein